jgi:hypothetical protein
VTFHENSFQNIRQTHYAFKDLWASGDSFDGCCVTALLTEEESRNRALELEQVADDGSTSAWGGWGGIDSSDVGKALAGLGIYGMPH